MRKLIYTLILLGCGTTLHAQEIPEKKLTTEITEATVFINGAQVVRKKQVDVQQGQSLLRFTGLSPYVEGQSVQVNAAGKITILSVNYQLNYMNELEKPESNAALQSLLTKVGNQIDVERAYLETLSEELAFLQENRKIENENENANLLREIGAFYASRVREIKLEQLQRNKTVDSLINEQARIEKQLQETNAGQPEPTGEVWVKIEAPSAVKVDFELAYLVKNAGWNPSYDIRVENINEPARLTYKANVYQKTKVDWKNVKLKISSGNPAESATAPKLQTYFLNYHASPPTYGSIVTRVTGRITSSEDNEPLPGVTVNVKGTTIGVVSNIDGFYDISIPPHASALVFSYVGFKTQEIPVANRPTINVTLTPDIAALQELVVVGYGTDKKRKSEAAPVANIEMFDMEEAAIPVRLERVVNQTSVEFDIATPYSIPSDGQNYAISMETFAMPANYLYTSIPKVVEEAYLIAEIADWEQYDLLEGEANLFFEGTYVGKTVLDIQNTSDTLTLSLGRDKQVAINREKQKNYTTRQFIGSKQEETLSWLISVKNNKPQTVRIVVSDQIPVSTLQEIEVSLIERSGAQLNQPTGELKWEIELEPGQSRELVLTYSVKYPKNRNLVIQ